MAPPAFKISHDTRLTVVQRRHDVTEREKTADFLRIHRDLGISLSSAANLGQALDHVLQATFRIDGIDCGGVYLLDESTGDLHLVAHQRLSRPFVEAVSHCRADSVETGRVMTGKAFYVPRSTASDAVRQACRAEGLRAIGVVPVCHQGRVIGALNMASRGQDEIPTTARNSVEAIATSIGGAVTRFKAESRLHDSEKLYRTLVETAREGIGITDPEENIVFANRAFAELLGCRREEVVGRNLREFSDQEEFERFGIETQKRLRGKASSYEIKIHTKSGQSRWVIVSAAPLYDENGKFTGTMGLLTDVSEQKKSAAVIEEERQLLRRLLDLHERDRQLIAYEIHDGVAQQLTGALYNLQAFQRIPEKDSDEAQQLFETGIELLGHSVAEVRQLIGGLRPPILDESGIVAAVDYLVCEAREREGMDVELLHDVRFERLAPPLETAVFRIVQESLNNACRHSRTDKIRVELLQQDHQIQLSIRDWGIGFREEEVDKQRFGLQGIRERARLLGGSATIETALDQGTHIRVCLPIVEAADET